MHKRVVPDILANVSGTQPELLAALDALPPHSHSVVVALEELVASLYAPQKPTALSSSLAAFSDAIHKLHASAVTGALLPSDADVAEQLSALALGGNASGRGNGDKQKKDPRRWFDACLAQIDKSAKAVDELLASDSATTT